MWKNIVEPERPQMTAWYGAKEEKAICTSGNWGNYADIHSQYLIPTAFLWQEWLRERVTLRYIYIAYLVTVAMDLAKHRNL